MTSTGTADLDPQAPSPEPARVALLMAIDWPSTDQLKANPRALFDATIDGKPMTAEQRTLLGECTRNDLAAMVQLTDEGMRITQERHDDGHKALGILHRYGFGSHEDDTIGQARERMTATDRAEFDRLADTLWPDGYLWLTDEVSTTTKRPRAYP